MLNPKIVGRVDELHRRRHKNKDKRVAGEMKFLKEIRMISKVVGRVDEVHRRRHKNKDKEQER